VFGLQPVIGTKDPVTLGGEFVIPPNAELILLLPQIGKDKAAFGPDADQFNPDRMYGENFARLPKNSWKVSTRETPLFIAR